MAPILRHLVNCRQERYFNSSEQKTTFSPQRTLKINQLHEKLQHWPTHFSREVTCCNFSKSDWSVQNHAQGPMWFPVPLATKIALWTLIWRKSHWCSENILSLSRCYKYSEINFPLYTSISTVVSVFLNVLGLFWRKIFKTFLNNQTFDLFFNYFHVRLPMFLLFLRKKTKKTKWLTTKMVCLF